MDGNIQTKDYYKMSILNPAVRLALFKNNENKHPPVKPPKKPQTTKIGYFEGFVKLEYITIMKNHKTSEYMVNFSSLVFSYLLFYLEKKLNTLSIVAIYIFNYANILKNIKWLFYSFIFFAFPFAFSS
ncbi:Leucine-rich repeat and IQ domain-containing protein 1, partial [Ophiophagus hannah]